MANNDKRLNTASDFIGFRHKWQTVAVQTPTRTLTKEETGKRFIFFDANPAITLPLDAVADETVFRIFLVGTNNYGGSIDSGTGNLIFAAYAENGGLLQAIQQSHSNIWNNMEYEISFVGDPDGVIGSPAWISNMLILD